MNHVVCRRCESELAEGDLRCPVCFLSVYSGSEGANGLEGPHALGKAEAKVLRCEGCGAALRYDMRAKAPACVFCKSVVHLETQADPLEEAEIFPPFEVTPEAAREALQRFLRVPRFFAPGNLSKSALIEGLQPLRWVAWVFDVEAEVSFAADSEVGARRAPYAPLSGQFEETYRNVLISASRGLTSSETAQLIPYYRATGGSAPLFGEMEATEGQLTEGGSGAGVELTRYFAATDEKLGVPVNVERFSVQRSGARQAIRRALIELAKASARRRIPGQRVRKLSVEVAPRRLVTRRVALPAYVAAYRFENKPFRAIVHGTQADCVVGKPPVSAAKVMGVVVVAVLVVFLALWATLK